MNKDILSQAEIDALLSPLKYTEDAGEKEDELGGQLTVSTVISHAFKNIDQSLPWKKGDFIPFSGDAFDVVINGTLVAQAEIIESNNQLGIRLTEVINKKFTGHLE